jgi:hypothetical protein
MPATEASRHALYQRLDAVLGQEDATTLMEHLPPVGWGDVATKQDVDQLHTATKQDLQQLRAATKHDTELLRHDIGALGDSLRVEFHKDMRNFFLAYTTTICAIAGIVIAVVGQVM